jgi:hypothetical protein
MKPLDRVSGWLRRPIGYFGREWNRMAPRERRLAGILGGAVVVAIVVAVAVLTVQSLAEIRDDNDAARDALAAIAKHRDEFQDAKNKMAAQEARIGREPPQLAADLETAAKEVNIAIPETQSRPAVPVGKRYLEHSVDVTLRQVDLLSLAKFLNRVESGRRLIVVSRMSLKRAFAEGEKLNVSLTATTWERVAETAPKRKPAAGTRERS